ncbi:MAG: ComF family protein [Bacteroidetes bacterium]|nr:MAG: ComF family protein [Bacteroidota bacterium]MBL1143486.1 ComF family protein [Bacteroidota bacterium]NOG56289.1 ComF family protein [Bacteroidota bacterium]
MITALTSLLFPKVCFACGETLKNKQIHICASCYQNIPRTNFFDGEINMLEKKFWGRIPIQHATAFLYFIPKGRVQRLIHHFKYYGQKEIGITLGEWAAAELMVQNFFSSIDIVVPIPIHELKKRKRGFNQSDFIAEGIQNMTGIKAITDNLEKRFHTESQTRKSRFKRWENVKTTFAVKDTKLFEGKHILLVDDVITTGATIEACAIELLKIQDLRLSLLSIAMTH